MNKSTPIAYIKLIAAGLLMASIISFLFFFLVSCQKDEPTPSALPTITTVSPASGLAGATVTITGTNFSTTEINNEVSFGTASATVTDATATQLIATVPVGATTGKINITVNGKTASSANDFIVLLQPTIASFSPSSGIVLLRSLLMPMPKACIRKACIRIHRFFVAQAT